MNTTTNKLDYNAATTLAEDLWNANGDGQIGLSETHLAITGSEWDGKDESKFEEIIETFAELFKTQVSINVENECVNLVGIPTNCQLSYSWVKFKA